MLHVRRVQVIRPRLEPSQAIHKFDFSHRQEMRLGRKRAQERLQVRRIRIIHALRPRHLRIIHQVDNRMARLAQHPVDQISIYPETSIHLAGKVTEEHLARHAHRVALELKGERAALAEFLDGMANADLEGRGDDVVAGRVGFLEELGDQHGMVAAPVVGAADQHRRTPRTDCKCGLALGLVLRARLVVAQAWAADDVAAGEDVAEGACDDFEKEVVAGVAALRGDAVRVVGGHGWRRRRRRATKGLVVERMEGGGKRLGHGVFKK